MKAKRMWLAPLAVALFPVAVLAAGIDGIEVISNRADLVSGGDALVEVKLSAGVDPATIAMTLNGSDVTTMFAMRPNGRYAGLVTGLAEGDNELRARLPDGTGARIKLRNHPIGGPVFSGTPVEPWLCRTQNQNNPALGPAVDAKCNAPTVVELFYRNLSNQFVAYSPANPPAPSAILSTTTDQGKTVPFVVQRVTGTANRGIYQIAVLVDPTKPIEPWSTEQPWNHKYFNTFGGACSVHYQQPTVGNVLSNVAQLARGFAVGTSSLNTYGNQCNDIISAEALMMTKEIVAERYGPIRYTIGNGGSAGTMQQHLIAEGYPGLLNGLTTNLLYEDHWYQVVSSFDCILLFRYFGLPNAALGTGGGNPLFASAAERQKVWGSNPGNPDAMCGTKINFTLTELVPGAQAGCSGPSNDPATNPAAPWRWHPVTNPFGTRCAIADYQKAMFGVGPDGRAPRPLDNVGVQYGLNALLAGTLSPEQFVHVNAGIGGLDIDGIWQPQRTAADLGALATLYRTGRIVSGRGSASVAEIDLRNNITDTGFHPPFHSFTYRARLDRNNGNHDSHVIWVPNGGPTPDQVLGVDAWLAAVEADTSGDPLPVKISRNRPATVFDSCYRAGGVVQDVMCNGGWQYYGNPRLVAGWPFTLDHFKCELKPLNPADYPVNFTPDQWTQLQQAFPNGVCDYSKPPVAQQPSLPWVTFAAGPGGQPLGDAPKAIGVNPPVAQCKNVTLQACSAQVDVNNGTFDPDGDSFTLAQAPAGPYALGTTRVTLSATDALGLTGSCQADVRVVDATAPIVSGASASPGLLWPPNRRMAPVSVAVGASDVCSGNVSNSCRIVSISGDDAATPADWRITGALRAELRADRSGKGNGRTYALTVECTDASGNAARQVTTVLVPHDRGEE